MIHKTISSVNYNNWWKRFNTKLKEPTNKNLIKVSKVVKPTNKETLLLNFDD